MTDKELEQKASDLMNVFFEFMCDSDLEKYIDDNASLTESGEYLLAVIKKWLKDNKYSPDSVKVSSSLRYFLTSEKSKKLNK